MEDVQRRRAIEKMLLEEKAKKDDGSSDMGFSSNYNKFEQFKPAPTSTPTGMTPNAVSPSGEAYSSWGARTGDWGAMQGPAAAETTPAMAEMGTAVAPAAAEVAPAVAEIAPEVGAGGMATAAAPYAALAATIGAFKLNDDHMSKGSGKTFGGEMEEAFSESFGKEGWGGLIKEKSSEVVAGLGKVAGAVTSAISGGKKTDASIDVVDDKFGKVGTAIMTSLKSIGKLIN